MNWIPFYIIKGIRNRALSSPNQRHAYLCICDHFEPYWNNAAKSVARNRIRRWVDEYPRIAEKYRDADGHVMKYSFFYPIEEYRHDDMAEIASLCQEGFGEVEIHLHHDKDTAENLRKTLLDFKSILHEKHGLLSVHKHKGGISYGFIHGNWSLANSRWDGRWCGVNNEISVLEETGCFGDFTMPSAPSETQTRKVNSIYYAVGDRAKPKSHDWGVDAAVGRTGRGLLMVQGPLCPSIRRRKLGLIPRIENGGLKAGNPVSSVRVADWFDQMIHVKGAPEHVFIKLYTHGTQEKIMQSLFERGELDAFFSLTRAYAESRGILLHYVSAREMVNMIHALEYEARLTHEEMRNFVYLQPRRLLQQGR